MKKCIFSIVFSSVFLLVNAQFLANYELNAGVAIQKTQKLYWENGIGVDFTSDFLLDKKMYLKVSYVTSRLGSAMGTNAIRQDNFTVGADWHFFHKNAFHIFTGINTGFFYADYEIDAFDILPNSSPLLQFNTGVYYKFNNPFTASLSIGYNFVNGNGTTTPGTLFPVFYQFKVLYSFKLSK